MLLYNFKEEVLIAFAWQILGGQVLLEVWDRSLIDGAISEHLYELVVQGIQFRLGVFLIALFLLLFTFRFLCTFVWRIL